MEMVDMNEIEERMPLIIECPHCHVRVIPTVNNVCPNCHEDVTDMTGVDPNQVPLTVSETEEFPSHCYSCDQYTDQYVRLSSDGESSIERFIFGDRRPEDTTNIIVYLPVCELCSEKEVELVEADYDLQTMVIMVHRKFRDRVFHYRENPPRLIDENFDDDM
jgi:hypothetical protein